MRVGEQVDVPFVGSLFYPYPRVRPTQLCAAGSSLYLPWLYPSEESLIGVLPYADLVFEFVRWLANLKRGISVSVILFLELVLSLWLSEGECLSTVHGGPAGCLLESLEQMCVRP